MWWYIWRCMQVTKPFTELFFISRVWYSGKRCLSFSNTSVEEFAVSCGNLSSVTLHIKSVKPTDPPGLYVSILTGTDNQRLLMNQVFSMLWILERSYYMRLFIKAYVRVVWQFRYTIVQNWIFIFFFFLKIHKFLTMCILQFVLLYEITAVSFADLYSSDQDT